MIATLVQLNYNLHVYYHEKAPAYGRVLFARPPQSCGKRFISFKKCEKIG